jgi:transcriptional regulator with PAS, ATPase and Fis domain
MMIEIVKNKLWNLLEEKDVLLSMIYDRSGKIIWHKGRDITGEKICSGEGFCRSFIDESIKRPDALEEEDSDMRGTGKFLPGTGVTPAHKRLIIEPLNSPYYLYIESGDRHSFNVSELKTLRAMGDILAEMIACIKINEKELEEIAGKSTVMKKVREMVLSYAIEEEPVLLLGETGVGKSYTAELIHRHSGRSGKFVVASAPNLQENLFECTMFGHKKGAFTDAKFDRKGLVEEARGGTLFIDEISEIPLSSQASLLRFIESNKYRVLGESFEREADVRIIAASNKDLPKAIEDKEFREDLYYRLNVLEIMIPPLKNRKEDIKAFVNEKLEYLRGKKIGKGFTQVLFSHEWPGNLRELITVLKRAGICSKDPITGEDIKDIINQTCRKRHSDRKDHKFDRIWNDLKEGKTFWEVVKKPFLDRELNRAEAKCIISKALMEAGGKYKDSLKIVNLEEKEYSNFMRFLHDNRLNCGFSKKWAASTP